MLLGKTKSLLVHRVNKYLDVLGEADDRETFHYVIYVHYMILYVHAVKQVRKMIETKDCVIL